jgi:starch synthase
VIDLKEDPLRANGIKFYEHSGRALAKSMRKAFALYGEPELLHRYRVNGMAANFSWEKTAEEYVRIYNGG